MQHVRKRRWLGWSLLVLGLTYCACTPYTLLRRSLSPLGFAWFLDLERIRGIYRRAQRTSQLDLLSLQKLEADRWQRAVKVTFLAFHRMSKRRKWSASRQHEVMRLVVTRLHDATTQAREPFGRWALAEAVAQKPKFKEVFFPLLLQMLNDDRISLVRKQALKSLFTLQPPESLLTKAASRALADPDYWVRAAVLHAVFPLVYVSQHPLRRLAFPLLGQCVRYDKTKPRQETFSHQNRLNQSLSSAQLLTQLRFNCMRLMLYLQPKERPKVRKFLLVLKQRPDAIGKEARRSLQRLSSYEEHKTPLPSFRLKQK